MGQGMIIISPNPHGVIKVAREHGIESKQIGYVSKKPLIRIKNRGAMNSEDLIYKKGPAELVFEY